MSRNLTLRFKFFLFITAVITVFLAVVFILAARSVVISKNYAFSLAKETAEKYKNEIMVEFEDVRMISETLTVVLAALKTNDVTSAAVVNDILENSLTRTKYMNGINVTYGPGVFELMGGEQNGNPYLHQLPENMVMQANFIFPIVSGNKIIGAVNTGVVLDRIQEIAAQAKTGAQRADLTLFSNSGVIAVHPDRNYIGKEISGILINDAVKVKEAIKNGDSFVSYKKDQYSVYIPIQFGNWFSPWSVAVHFPMDLILADTYKLRNYMIIVSLFSACFMVIVLSRIIRSVTRPLLALSNTAKKIGEGSNDTRIEAGTGDDEIDILSRSFKQMTEKLIASKKQAEESNWAKSNFLSSMSHEMRTPLNAIIGMTTIGRSASGIEKKDYALSKIGDASINLLGVINEVLDMSKIEANKMELSLNDFDFEKMIHRIVNVINYRLGEKQQNFHVAIDQKIPKMLVGDELRLSQVITNLLSNAVKFTPDNGLIRLDAAVTGDENGIFTLRIAVTDSGIGISPEQQVKLFRPFQQADPGTQAKFGGTGLGLIISKRIVEMMEGEIHIESELGKGASFVFTVRLGRSKAEKRSLLRPDVNWKNVRLLAVDDDPETMEHFRQIAGRLGITCDTVSGGKEASALLDRNILHDICFIDWKMPGMNGTELTKKIKERSSGHSVVIMISAIDWSSIADKAKEAGVDYFLPKPLFPSDIVDSINECFSVRSSTDSISSNIRPAARDTFPGCRILLAEDIEINREIVLSLLEPLEPEIDCAENGREALKMYSENPERYDLIFMDIQMPEMDGLEATRNIRSLDSAPEGKAVPIIAMTANVFRTEIEKCLDAGMNDHVGKPLEFEKVLEKLRKYLPCGGKDDELYKIA